MCVYLTGVYLMGVHFTGMHLIGVCLISVHSTGVSPRHPPRARGHPNSHPKSLARDKLLVTLTNMPAKIRAYQHPILSLSPTDRVLALYEELTAPPPAGESVCFDALPLQHARFVSASAESQSTTWSFIAAPELCNKGGNLHGGCAATLLDSLTSTALLTIAKPGFLDGGHVSRTLSCTYLLPVPMDTECVVECWVVAAGKRMANVQGEIRTKDGKVCVSCVHDKAGFGRAEL